MGPASAASRWTDEEHNILVQKTNKQIELEAKDRSKEISWAAHWQQVSMALGAHGYSRTPGACQLHWKRTINSQVANEEAAGPRWEDSEHQILLRMTEDQLSLESNDPASIIPWPQHWKNVSLELKRNGYTRSVDACAAYWDLLEANSVSPTESGTEAESQSPEDNGRSVDHETDAATPEQHSTETQPVAEPQPWTDAEHENLVRLLKAQHQLEEQNGAEDLFDAKLWTVIARLHKQSGFDRSWEACKAYWQDCGRIRISPQNRMESIPKTTVEIRSAGSKTSNLSSLWSPVNVLEDSSAATTPYTFEDPASTNHPKAMPQAQMLSLVNQATLSGSIPISNSAKKIPVSGSEPSGFEPNRQHESMQPNFLSEKPKQRRHRFTAKEKAVLEAEAASNAFPELERREELARQLGAEEKSIRNWFNSFRRESRRSQEGSFQRSFAVSTSTEISYPVTVDHPVTFYSTPEQTSKRIHGSLDTDSSIQHGLPHDVHLFKKPRMGPEANSVNNEQAFATTSQSPVNATTPVSNTTPWNSNHREVTAMSVDTPLTIREPAPSVQSASNSSAAPNIEQIQLDRATTKEPDPVVSTPSLREDRGPQQRNNSTPIPESSSATPQPASTSFTAPTAIPSDDASEKEWAARRLQNFQTEIQNLEHDNATRSAKIFQIIQAIEDVEDEGTRIYQQEQEEIAETLKRIKEKYDRQREIHHERQNALHTSKEIELEGLRKNDVEIDRKKPVMAAMRAVLDYHSL